MASSVTIGGHGTRVKGLDKLLRRLKKLPELAKAELAKGLDASADDLVTNIKAIAPVSDLEPHPGALKASVHKTAGRHELSRFVIVDAKDAKGRGYAPHVEFGHMVGKRPSGDGVRKRGKITGDTRAHVRAEPFFYPAIKRRKPAIRSRMSRAGSKAVQASGPSD